MNQRLIALIAAFFFIALAGCSSNSGSSSLGSGDLNVSLTDAPSPDYKAVYISVNQVEVKASSDNSENGWQVVDIVNKTINLLDLTGGILEDLGTRNLPAQTYNQLRLILADAPDDENNLNGDPHPHANYVILNDGSDTVHELKVPSGYQSGIKLVKQFTISVSGLTELILDFDAMKSVVQAGSSGQWILKPVIEVLDTVTLAGIGGSVTNSATPGVAQQAAWVSLQTDDSFALDHKDKVTTHASTLTDVAGSYLLRSEANTYNLIVFKEGFVPACRRVTTVSGSTITQNIALLTAAAPGTLEVTINGFSQEDESVTVSIRADGICGTGIPIFYEITSRSYSADGTYTFSLPPDNYTIVVYGDNMSTIRVTRDVTSGGTRVLTVNL
ncbi:hypothetical protein DSLASN_05700 [Desulfoluna limicola]|uniref:DUF4382 domain-containing protein n=1 Tax=Desulfoluna limicola TaxID=2810562 RepID=A0ABM7PCV6_9BACT|nr:DUF4382 domain-containing protein [Desulfoluna limicola]BCS94938.1 hypothetical protein DSLASN_05700 [Desulfoluna limicola]